MGFIELIIAIIICVIWFIFREDMTTAPKLKKGKKVSFAETRNEILYDKKTGNVLGARVAPT